DYFFGAWEAWMAPVVAPERPLDPAAREKAHDDIQAHVDVLEQRLAGRDWLGGGESLPARSRARGGGWGAAVAGRGRGGGRVPAPRHLLRAARDGVRSSRSGAPDRRAP